MTDQRDLVPEFARRNLSYRQRQTLERHYRDFEIWLAQVGKDPERNKGYAETSVKEKLQRTIRFHQWVWNHTGDFCTRFSRAHANEFEQGLENDTIGKKAGEPYTEGSKRKLQEAVKAYFRFLSCKHRDEPWNPNLTFRQSVHDQADYLTLDERERLYQATLTYGDLGRYSDLSPEAREQRKQYLAQKLEKPKSEVTPEDFADCRKSWKIPSLIGVSLDIGARPVFVQRASKGWYQPEKGVLKIPREDSPKNNAYWNPTLSSRTIQNLDQWLRQREAVPKYGDSDQLWLNREGNPYRSDSLNYLLGQLLDEADINQEGRKLTWTSIRRSTGTYLTYMRSLAFAKEQLRHKSIQSTLRYVEIPVEARQDALDQLQGGAVANITNNSASVDQTQWGSYDP